jgi:UDP-2-acetamido-3-amino-2,3-dideoxy-glucuronate N-acetyltransferase
MMYIHPLADVKTTAIGNNTEIWQFSVILEGAVIGENCNINCHTFIENDVVIGNNVTVKSGTSIWDAIRIEDDVFLGPNIVFATDPSPRSKKRVIYPVTTIKKGASLGSNTTVLPGITIGRYAMTGAASLITKDVPNYALVFGSPARQHGWVDESGQKLKKSDTGKWIAQDGAIFEEHGDLLVKL